MFAFFDLFQQAMTQIRVYALRSALTALGIVIAVTGLVTIAAVVQGLDKGVNQVLSQLGSDLVLIDGNYMKDRVLQRPMSKQEWQKLSAQLVNVSPVVATSKLDVSDLAYRGKKSEVTVLAASYFHPQLYQQFPTQGRFLMESDETSRLRVCVISEHLIAELGLPQMALGSVIILGTFSLKVIGVVPGNGDAGQGLRQIGDVYVPFSVAEELMGQERRYAFGFRVSDQSQMTSVLSEVKRILHQSLKTPDGEAEDFLIESSDQIRDSALLLEKAISKVFFAIVAISLVVGGVGVMNVMLVSVTERTREIGILMALGASKQTIRWQFLLEAILLSVMGAIVGVLLGSALAHVVVRYIPKASTPSVPLWAIVSAVGVSVLVALVSGALPAARAAELDPVVALSKE
ncbi:ABC transporter permease [Undibacterium seohonense]|uniref:ABC transporter permease n=1 Tax=Undibacterium seohonense TaxID=1344950 RepID=A0ABR6X6Q0_9BURK|nr:ABC transporter permease [Undibacterium seohonense]MBC3808640.1 ABC transporter permease [Undibacterium seohonense]